MKWQRAMRTIGIGAFLIAAAVVAKEPSQPERALTERLREVFAAPQGDGSVAVDLTKFTLDDVLREAPVVIARVKADGQNAIRIVPQNQARWADRISFHPIKGGGYLCAISAVLTDRHLQILEKHQDIIEFDIRDSDVTDAAFASFAKFPGLRLLSVHSTKALSEAIADNLAKCAKVRWLTLHEATLTGAAGKSLAQLPILSALTITKGELGKDALADLSRKTELRRLELFGVRVPEGSIASIGQLKELRNLALTKVRLANEDFQALRGLTKLEYVNLEGTNLANSNLEGWDKLTELRQVNFSGTHVTGAGLVQLRGNAKLKLMEGDGLNVPWMEQQKLANLYGWYFSGACSCGCLDIGPQR